MSPQPPGGYRNEEAKKYCQHRTAQQSPKQAPVEDQRSKGVGVAANCEKCCLRERQETTITDNDVEADPNRCIHTEVNEQVQQVIHSRASSRARVPNKPAGRNRGPKPRRTNVAAPCKFPENVQMTSDRTMPSTSPPSAEPTKEPRPPIIAATTASRRVFSPLFGSKP